MEKWNKKLLLEDGSQFYGYGFGSQEEKITEIVFNTAPVGYQEILSDPSYTYQTVVMAYPLIGNYGIAKEDFETKQPSIGGLAYGAGTYKLKFGHRGGNHPVKNLKTGKIEITSQNHSYAVDYASLKNTDLEMTHINLLDHTVEGIACRKDHVFSVQYHPESAPGPQDSGYLFDQFIQMMEENKHGKAN